MRAVCLYTLCCVSALADLIYRHRHFLHTTRMFCNSSNLQSSHIPTRLRDINETVLIYVLISSDEIYTYREMNSTSLIHASCVSVRVARGAVCVYIYICVCDLQIACVCMCCMGMGMDGQTASEVTPAAEAEAT